ncbi:MAG: type II toxin-antitoxin system VapC family toxin [Xanthomonadales bacterium]|nr:type II toxin-antitoxin system VapC family toxin [Xanthomonadales bacterium]
MLRYMLDTNIAVYVLKRKPLQVLDVFNQRHGQMAISSIVYAELAFGAEKSLEPVRNQQVVESFCSRLVVLPYTEKAAQHYGRIRAVLERSGTPIGVNDLHIAAHACGEGLILVSNNLREFECVPGLVSENWL